MTVEPVEHVAGGRDPSWAGGRARVARGVEAPSASVQDGARDALGEFGVLTAVGAGGMRV